MLVVVTVAGGWLPDTLSLVMSGFMTLLFPVATAIAVVRYRLYDIDRLINRTLVYGLLTALLGAVYAGLALVSGQLFGGLGAEPPSWAVAGATLTVAALFQPARRRPHPGSRGPAVQPAQVRRGQDRRGIQRTAP
jgi:hypothetical protein